MTAGAVDPPLRLSLDASAVPDRPAGAGRYIVELWRALGRRDDVAVELLTRRGDLARWSRSEQVHPLVPDPRPVRLAWEQMRMARVLVALGVQVHHGPHYTMPGRTIGGHGVPAVVTVHDCTFFDHPEWHERSKVHLFRWAIRRAARHAALVICVSRHTAQRLEEVCTVRAAVQVIPHGIDHQRFGPSEPAAGADRRVLQAIGIDPDRRAVVFVGTLEPRKNVAGLVDAFDQVASTHRDAVLVLAGLPGWGGAEVERRIGAARHGEQVLRTGYVPDSAVPALFRHASVVAYPSLEEGFGFPAIEALACGAPLVTTSGTAMADLAAGAALEVAPGNVTDLASGLDMLLSEDPLSLQHQARRSRGIEVAARYTWEQSAADHASAYRSVLE